MLRPNAESSAVRLFAKKQPEINLPGWRWRTTLDNCLRLIEKNNLKSTSESEDRNMDHGCAVVKVQNALRGGQTVLLY
jgi:hypothetical protein